jgi:serine/threonine protein phosphatase PrpC
VIGTADIHVFNKSPNNTNFEQTYTSTDSRIVAVGHGITGWAHEVDGEILDCLAGDLALAIFFSELDALYSANETDSARENDRASGTDNKCEMRGKLTDLLYKSGDKVKSEAPGSSVVAAAAMFNSDFTSVEIAHAGDCRAYLLRNGELNRLTEDHNVVSEMLTANKISQAEAKKSPFLKFVTRTVARDYEIDQTDLELIAQDRIFLCTAELWHLLDEKQLETLLSNHANAMERMEILSMQRSAECGWAAATLLIS